MEILRISCKQLRIRLSIILVKKKKKNGILFLYFMYFEASDDVRPIYRVPRAEKPIIQVSTVENKTTYLQESTNDYRYRMAGN